VERSLKKSERMPELIVKDKAKTIFALNTLKKSVIRVFEHDLYHNILLFAVDIKGVERIDTKKSILLSAISRFSGYKDHSLASFKKAVNKEINERRKAKKKTFSIIFLLNIDKRYIIRKRIFKINGRVLRHRSHRYILRNYNLSKFVKEAKLHSKNIGIKIPFNPNMFQHIECKVTARTATEAFWKAYEDFELLRAIINFSNNFGILTKQFGTRNHLNSFLPSPFYLVFSENNRYEHFRYELVNYKYKVPKLSLHYKEKVFNKLISVCEKEVSANSLRNLVLESLTKYGQALDSLEWESNFLKLWRVLELITFYSEESSIKSTGNRIKLLFGQSPFWNYNIDSICELRNSLVHKGIFPEEGLDHLVILKYIVEQAIWQLFILCKYFKEQSELRLFYEHNSSGSGNLQKEIRVIRKILRFRKKP
jgi:hypothetical protein